MNCRALVVCVALGAVIHGAACTRSQTAALEQFRIERADTVAAETTFAGMRGRYASFRVRLTSTEGLVATGRLLQPGRTTNAGGSLPAVLLNNGRELDSRALEYLPSEFGDVVVLSLDYPAELPYAMELSDVLGNSEELREAAERIPLKFSMGAAYLAARTDVDTARLAIAATSFAVPFAVIAAAADDRFANVALIYGAGELHRVVAANLELRPKVLRPAAAWVATRPFNGLEPERWIARVAPRPVVMINGMDDPQMPRESVDALYAAAREPKSLVWLSTGHLMPGDSALIRTLVDSAFARLPVLRTAVRADPGSE